MALVFVSYITYIVCCHASEECSLTTNVGITAATRAETSPSTDIGLIDSSFLHCGSLFSSTSPLTVTQRFTVKDTHHQHPAVNALNTISRSKVTPLVSFFPSTSPLNVLPRVFTLFVLLLTSASVAALCESTSKTSILLILFVLFQMTCSALFIPTQTVGGNGHTCALSQNHTVKCWGYNKYGQLGYGDRTSRGDEPGQMGDSLNTIDLGTNFIVTQIVAGRYHTCALSRNKTVKCWGYNKFGQLGYGDTNNRGDNRSEMGDYLNTIDLGTAFIPTQISAGWHHTCALSRANTVKCWGYNFHGGLGYGDSNNRGGEAGEMGDSLNTLNFGSNFVPMQVTAGSMHTCALSKGNTVKCWGFNQYGQLGYGDTDYRADGVGEMGDSLDNIDLGTDFIPTKLSAGLYHTCSLSQTNTLKCFGRNNVGQLGYGDTNDRGDEAGEMGDALDTIDLGTNFITRQTVTGYGHTCALSQNGTVKCWGINSLGQLGLGDTITRGNNPGQMGDSLHTIQLGTDFIATQISAGERHNCALSQRNTVKCWGKNLHGHLGYGDSNNRGDEAGEMGDALKIIYLMDTATPTLTPTNHPINNPMTTETHEDSTHTRSSSLLAGVLIVLFGTITVVAIIGCFVVRCRRLKHEIQKEKLANPQTQEEYKLLNDHK